MAIFVRSHGLEVVLTVETPGRHVIAIQMLRAIAATMVVFVHIDTELVRLHFAPLGSGWLASGVDIFFVISGFIMWTSVDRRNGMSAATFLKNRFIRIAPLYWSVTTFVVLVACAAPQLLKSTVLSRNHVIASYLFIPARHPIYHKFWPVVVPGWSLNYEMVFYLLFAVAISAGSRSRVLRFSVTAALLSALFLVATFTKDQADVMAFYANPVLFEFLLGIALGALCTSALIRPSYAYGILIALGFLLLDPFTHPSMGFAATIVGATLIVSGAVFLPAISENWMSKLGDASYSLYLTHGATLAAIAWFWQQFGLTFAWQVYVLIAVATAVAVALLVYRCFELPVTSALKARSVGKQRPKSADLSAGGAPA